MKYYVYIIYSGSNDLYYIGQTNDLDGRLIRHNSNRNKFTKDTGPWKFVVSYTCNSKSKTYQLELKLKSFKNPTKAIAYLKNLVQNIPTS